VVERAVESADSRVERTAFALRLLADDLTGALDTSAQFAVQCGALPVRWNDPSVASSRGSRAVDTGCRELSPGEARSRFAELIDVLAPAADCLVLLKLDSLLRGHAGDEIADCADRWPERSIVVAPAFPAQQRVTRRGRQYWFDGRQFMATGEDLCATLAARGLAFKLRHPGAAIPAGVSIFDAETDADLAMIVAAAPPDEPLWCGSAGLGHALAQRSAPGRYGQPEPIEQPLLGLFGTDHPVTRQQLSAVSQHVFAVQPAEPQAATAIAEAMRCRGAAFVSFALPVDVTRADARHAIDATIADLLPRLPRPQTLIVSGGETLRAVCGSLGADHLVVDGQIAPGIPSSRIRGGAWDGVRVISKSGAFGAPDLLRTLVEPSSTRVSTGVKEQPSCHTSR
jgi:uncharacterized protein YgbK (DUF1537 family)